MTERTITLKVKGEAELRQVTKQMEELGQSYDKVRVQFEQGAKVSDQAGKSADELRGQFKGLATELGLMYGLGEVVGMIKDFGVASIQAAREAAAAEAQLAAVLKSTGGAAGVTKEQLTAMASELQKVTMFSDEAVIGGQSLLLTFTRIGKDVFPQATQTMLDMSQALGQDLKSSAIQMGKALNDPIKGITALSRVGVSFSESQKEMITSMVEAGNVAGAQKLILAELNTEFGGSAEAAREAAGSFKDLEVSFGDFQESFGGLMMAVGDTGVVDNLVKLFDDLATGAEAWQTIIQEQIPAIQAHDAALAKDAAQSLLAAQNQEEMTAALKEGARDFGVFQSELIGIVGDYEEYKRVISEATKNNMVLAGQLALTTGEFDTARETMRQAAADAVVSGGQWVSSLQAMNIAVTETTGNLAKLAQVGEMTLSITQGALDADAARWQGMANLTRTGGAAGRGQLETMAGSGHALTEEESAALKEQMATQEKLSKQLAKTMESSFETAANNIRSTIESVLKPSLDEVWQPPADAAHFDEDARRLATVATSGFGSEWLNQLTTQFAGQDFFQPIIQAMQAGDEGALKQAATDVLTNQVTKLWDTEMIKNQVRAQLQQDNLRQKLIDEIQQELGMEGMAVPIKTTAAAAGELTGEVKTKLEEATGHFDGFKQAITDQKWPEVGQDIVDGINKGIDDNIMKVREKLKDLAKEAIKAARQELEAKSPSQAFADVARDIISGLVQGLNQGQGAYQNALAQLLNLDSRDFNIGDMITKIDNPVERALKQINLSRDRIRFIMREMNQELRRFPDILRSGSAEEIERILRAAAKWNQAGLKYDKRQPVRVAIEAYIRSIMRMREELARTSEAARRANMERMIGGVGQFATQASQEAQNLNQRIVVLQTLLRQGANRINVGGQELTRAQAQQRLAQMINEQSGMQGNLQNILGANQRLQSFQERQGLLNLLAAPQQGAGSGQIIGGLSQLMNLLGNQLIQGARRSGDVRSYQIGTIIINSRSDSGGILNDLERLNELTPSGT